MTTGDAKQCAGRLGDEPGKSPRCRCGLAADYVAVPVGAIGPSYWCAACFAAIGGEWEFAEWIGRFTVADVEA